MHVIPPTRYQTVQTRTKKRPIVLWLAVVILVLLVINYVRPLPSPVATVSVSVPAAMSDVPMAWPNGGQAAVAAAGYGLLGTYGDQTPLSTASIAKVVVALCVLQKLPLEPGQSGPTYTISAADVANYERYVAQNGSLIPVTAGERLTEYQALEALMLPSANNIADSLVTWVFGSHDAYASYATTYVRQHGLNATHIGTDASGFDPSTTSTASDLTNLGLLALKSPVLLQIAKQRSAYLPVVGTVYNYNTVLGQNGITGLKTGNNDADPGAFLFTATGHIGGKDIPLTGAVMDAPDLNSALSTATALSSSLQQNFEQATIVRKGQQAGTVKTAWGASVAIVSSDTLQVIRWKTTPITETHRLDPNVASGRIGTLKIAAGKAESQTALDLAKPVPGPSFWWRLTRH